MQVNELEVKIKEAAQAYYTGEPIMSDEMFDSLVNELSQLNPNSEVLTVGWGSKEQYHHLTKRDHTFLVGSLPKVKITTMKDWCNNSGNTDEKLNASLSMKLDGISAVCYYDNSGKLKYVLTRNDGHSGYDITDNLAESHGIVYQLPNDLAGKVSWVRGELVIKKNEVPDEYANARNMVAGLANSAKRGEYHKLTHFVAYECDLPNATPEERKNKLKLGGFEVVRNISVIDFINEASEHYLNYNEDEFDYDYLCDGVVVNSPTESYALKFPNKEYEVEVVDVEISATPKGRLIPVIKIKPTEISGSTITYCSGFNFQSIVNEGIGVGAVIKITKANEVIPYWSGTVKPVGVNLPTEWNGSPVRWNGVHLEYELDKEPQTIFNLIAYHRKLGFGSSQIQYLIKDLGIYSIEKLSQVIKESGTPEFDLLLKNSVSAAYYQRAVEMFESMRVGYLLDDLLVATNSRGLGEVAAIACTEHYNNSPEAMLHDLDKFGELSKEAESKMPSYMPNEGIKENLVLIKRVLGANFPIKPVPEKVELSGDVIKVALTGKLSMPRSQLLQSWSDRVNVVEVAVNQADYLITDNPDSGSSKNKQAQKLGIKVISEAEFNSLIGY